MVRPPPCALDAFVSPFACRIVYRTRLGGFASALKGPDAPAGADGPVVLLLVSHGGILSRAFSGPEPGEDRFVKMGNCEIRVFDVCEGGSFARPEADPLGGANDCCGDDVGARVPSSQDPGETPAPK